MKQSFSRSVFYEGIDLLRGGAVFLVLWSHAGPVLPASLQAVLAAPWFRPGFWGVTIFFAISGFLVVGQLIDIATGQRAESLRFLFFVVGSVLSQHIGLSCFFCWLLVLLVGRAGGICWSMPFSCRDPFLASLFCFQFHGAWSLKSGVIFFAHWLRWP